MKVACDELRKKLFDPHISEFENSPSVPTYRLLVMKSSSLAPALLSIIRHHIAKKPDGSSMPYEVAAEIFIERGQTEDLLKLLSKLGDVNLRKLHEYRAYKLIARYLSIQKNQKLSAKSLEIVKLGVVNVMQTLASELDRAFPGLKTAYRWLEEMTNKRNFTEVAGTGRSDPEHDRILSRFVEMARGNLQTYRDWEVDTSPDGIDKDVADFEEEMAQRRPNFARCLQFWQDLLGRWSKKETESLREKIGHEETLFSVADVAQALENECDDERAHLAAGIMAMQSFIQGED
jgi:hypothetical protein